MSNPLSHSHPSSGIIPAQLGFLAIYNPSLGTTDETLEDQIVYYASAATLSQPRRRRHHHQRTGTKDVEISQEERNERLRQIGLAQGMVEFAKTFSGGKPVDSVDTERSRVVIHELEPGWWILASIDLTRLPLPPSKSATGSTSPPPGKLSGTTPSTLPPEPMYEYSTRDVKPPLLLRQDLVRAHELFLLHHAPSLSVLFSSSQQQQQLLLLLPSTSSPSSSPSPSSSSPSPKELLARYWDAFLSTWHVLLHGNPACSVLGGIKIAASGELGMGVGEEERGSGEREVLEGMVYNEENGLVDLVVGRYGAGSGDAEEGWIGCGNEPGAEDGAIFLGVGRLSRRALRQVVWWMEEVYAWGEGAYGVVDVARRRGRRKKRGKKEDAKGAGTPDDPGARDGKKTDHRQGQGDDPAGAGTTTEADSSSSAGGMDKMLSYLTLGYGTYWSLSGSGSAASSTADAPKPTDTPSQDPPAPRPSRATNIGRFLLPLADDTTPPDPTSPDTPSQTTPSPNNPHSWQTVILDFLPASSSDVTTPQKASPTPLHPAIYIHNPFIYILLFRADNPSSPLSARWPELSKTLHIQLSTLRKPLLASTSYRPGKPPSSSGGGGGGGQSQTSSDRGGGSGAGGDIYDLVFDHATLTIHSTIPNIPEPPFIAPGGDASASAGGGSGAGGGGGKQQQQQQISPAPWTRAEALSTHAQILSTLAAARADRAAAERTCKTSRGWWVVWSRVGDDHDDEDDDDAMTTATSAGGGDDTTTDRAATTAGDDSSVVTGDGDGGSYSYSHSYSGPTETTLDGKTPAISEKDIFLIRRASDQGGAGGGGRVVSASYLSPGGGGGGSGGSSGGGGGGGWADGASRLAQGIGVDTRRYIEGLLSLNR